jgi:hypothetical protein
VLILRVPAYAGQSGEDEAPAPSPPPLCLVLTRHSRRTRPSRRRTPPGRRSAFLSGLKEKVIAAKRNYAQRFVAPAGNEQDVHKIPERQRQNLEFVFASTLDEALRAALAKHHLKGYSPPV